MKKLIITMVAVVSSLSCWAADSQELVVIGQPSIFWHNGQWQTYKDGVWLPYGHTESSPSTRARSQAKSLSGSAPSRPGIARTESRERAKVRTGEGGIGQTTIGIGQPAGIGQNSGGLGKPNVGLGRTTIGIGQPNLAIGQPQGIGQTTIGIGKPNVGIGQNNTGIGQPNIGIGQPNGIGQTTIGIGKPMGFPPQQRSTSTDTPR